MAIKNYYPDPNTDRKRKRLFKPIDKKHIPRTELIKHIDKTHFGTNLALTPRVLRAAGKLEKIEKKKGTPQKQIIEKQVELSSRLISKWVDHMISGMKEKGLVKHDLSPKEERKLWIQLYNEFIEKFFLEKTAQWKQDDKKVREKLAREGITYKGKVPLRTFGFRETRGNRTKERKKRIIDEMDRTFKFSLPPKEIINRREKRQKYSKKAWRLVKEGVNAEKNLNNEIKKILKRIYSLKGKNYSREQVVQAKAVQICLAVSIYADLLERTKGENWTSTYTYGMMQIRPLLEKRNDIENAIIELDKVKIQE
jgi:hypothetical protein